MRGEEGVELAVLVLVEAADLAAGVNGELIRAGRRSLSLMGGGARGESERSG